MAKAQPWVKARPLAEQQPQRRSQLKETLLVPRQHFEEQADGTGLLVAIYCLYVVKQELSRSVNVRARSS
jgi:hypothetical protein